MVGEQSYLTGHDLDTLRLIEQALVLVGAVLLNDLVFLGDECCPVDRHLHRGKARIAWVGGIVDQPRRLDQVLGGQAAPVGAGASDCAKFGHHGGLAKLSGVQGRGKGRRAAAQNHQVIVFV